VLWDIALLIAGLAIIYVGGRFLIQGASSLALRLGMKPILVGVTIVAFGTSAPELFLALISSSQGAASVSVGNVLGANANDLTIVLGLAAVILPLATNYLEARLEIVATLSSLLLFGALALDGRFDWVDGLIFMSSFGVILYMLVTRNRVPLNGPEENGVDVERGWRNSTSFYLGALVLGVVALAISALKGQPDLAVGNALGSVFFNTLVVTGTVALISGVYFETSVVLISVIFLISVTLLITAMMRWKFQISRLGGTVLVALYIVFVIMMIYLG
jgi:cation:H+ antiporter